jgi:hypothetical protein
MAKKNKARVPKRIAGVKIPKRIRRALQPVARFAGTEFGNNVVAGVVVALATALVSGEDMRESLKDAAKRARKSGGGVESLALHLGRALVMPALVALHAKLPDEARVEQYRCARREHRERHAPEPAH